MAGNDQSQDIQFPVRETDGGLIVILVDEVMTPDSLMSMPSEE